MPPRAVGSRNSSTTPRTSQPTNAPPPRKSDRTPREKGMKGAIARAQELRDATPGSWIPQQFDNPANVAANERTTAQEIRSDAARKGHEGRHRPRPGAA